MVEQAWNALSNNSRVIALCTLAFFTIKGLLWLMVPVLVVRGRSSLVCENEPIGQRAPAVAHTQLFLDGTIEGS
jgi:hypothetical protein